jgi:hypothetical protein
MMDLRVRPHGPHVPVRRLIMATDGSPDPRTSTLKQLVADAIAEVDRLGYSRRSRNRYRATWEHLVAFADRERLGDALSDDVLARFLAAYRVGDGEVAAGEGWRRHLVHGLRVLAEFATRLTWKGRHPTVEEVAGEYADGVRLTKAQMKPVEARLERSKTLPKYDILIRPKTPCGR